MYEKMTDEEFFAEIEKLYGKEWKPDDLDPESEIGKEYIRRVTEGF